MHRTESRPDLNQRIDLGPLEADALFPSTEAEQDAPAPEADLMVLEAIQKRNESADFDHLPKMSTLEARITWEYEASPHAVYRPRNWPTLPGDPKFITSDEGPEMAYVALALVTTRWAGKLIAFEIAFTCLL